MGGIGDYFTRTDSSGTLTMLPDGAGSILGLVNSSGNLATHYTYQPFGATTTLGTASNNPFQFKSGAMDPSGLGLYYFRARYYSPTLQRFISPDPAGGVNLYPFANNDPVNLADPPGNEVISISGLGGIFSNGASPGWWNMFANGINPGAGPGSGSGAGFVLIPSPDNESVLLVPLGGGFFSQTGAGGQFIGLGTVGVNEVNSTTGGFAGVPNLPGFDGSIVSIASVGHGLTTEHMSKLESQTEIPLMPFVGNPGEPAFSAERPGDLRPGAPSCSASDIPNDWQDPVGAGAVSGGGAGWLLFGIAGMAGGAVLGAAGGLWVWFKGLTCQ